MVYWPLANIFTFQLAKETHKAILLHSVLVRFLLLRQNILTRSNMEKKVFTWLIFPCHSPYSRKSEGTDSSWNLEAWTSRDQGGTYLLTAHGLLNLLHYTTQEHLPTVVPHQSLIKKMPHRLAYRLFWCSFFPDDGKKAHALLPNFNDYFSMHRKLGKVIFTRFGHELSIITEKKHWKIFSNN